MNNSLAFVPGVYTSDDYEKKVLVETHENVSITYDIAGVGSRCLAGWVDKAIRIAVYIVSAVLALILLLKTYSFDEIIDTVADSFLTYYYLFYAVYLGLILLRVLYHLIAELASAGSSPGKKLVGIKVVQVTGEAATPVQLIIRNLLRVIDMIPGGSIVDGIIALYNKQGRRVGDLAAGTMVIKYRDNFSLSKIIADAEKAEADAEAGTADGTDADDGDFDILSFVRAQRSEKTDSTAASENATETPDTEITVTEPVSDKDESSTAFFDDNEAAMLDKYLAERKKYVNRFMYDQRFAELIAKRRGYTVTSGFTKNQALNILKSTSNFLKFSAEERNFANIAKSNASATAASVSSGESKDYESGFEPIYDEDATDNLPKGGLKQ